MSRQARAMLEATLYNLRYDMDCIGEGDLLIEQIEALTDQELLDFINEWEEDF